MGAGQINDEHGHATGDKVLVTLASALLREVRTSDTVARIGGEEFIVLAPGLNSERGMRLAERLRRMVAEDVSATVGFPVTVSIGAGVISGIQPDQLLCHIALIDRALYAAKETAAKCA